MKSGPPMVWIIEIFVISLNIFLWSLFYRFVNYFCFIHKKKKILDEWFH